MSLIEGLDDSILFFLLVGLVNVFFIIYFGIIYFRSNVLRQANSHDNEDSPQPPPPHDSGMCPICRGEPQIFAVETNCAHLFCGECLRMLWEQMGNIGSFVCPMCRQSVSLLFDVFSPEEVESRENERARDDIIQFVRMYNYRQNMNGAFALLDRIRQVPILLRHLYNEMLSGQLDSYLIARMIFSMTISFIYLALQTDVVPESFFGLIGLFDDLLFFLFAVFYIANVYRHFVGRVEEFHHIDPPPQ